MGMKRVKKYAYVADQAAKKMSNGLTSEEKVSAAYWGLIIADKTFNPRKTKKGFESWARMKCYYEIQEEARKKARYYRKNISLDLLLDEEEE